MILFSGRTGKIGFKIQKSDAPGFMSNRALAGGVGWAWRRHRKGRKERKAEQQIFLNNELNTNSYEL